MKIKLSHAAEVVAAIALCAIAMKDQTITTAASFTPADLGRFVEIQTTHGTERCVIVALITPSKITMRTARWYDRFVPRQWRNGFHDWLVSLYYYRHRTPAKT